MVQLCVTQRPKMLDTEPSRKINLDNGSRKQHLALTIYEDRRRRQFYLERAALLQALSSHLLPLQRLHFLQVSQTLA